MSVKSIVSDKNSENMVICFGGMALQMGGILPFEFLTYLSSTYNNIADLYFFVDKKQCWYHKGIDGISNNIDETVKHLDEIVLSKSYKKIIFMGVSAGGYASILFGSLCKNITDVIAFIPRTKYERRMIDDRYYDLNNIINNSTKYCIIGDISVADTNHDHHISQCTNLTNHTNVTIHKLSGVNMKNLRDNGKIKEFLDNLLFEQK